MKKFLKVLITLIIIAAIGYIAFRAGLIIAGKLFY